MAALTSAALVVGLTAAPAQAREDVPDVATSPPIVEPQVWDELATYETTVFWALLITTTDPELPEVRIPVTVTVREP